MAYFVSTGACGGHSVGLRPLRGTPCLALRSLTVPPIPLRSIASPDSSLRAMRLALRAPSCAILVPLGLAVGHPARPSALPRAPFLARSPRSKRKNDNRTTTAEKAVSERLSGSGWCLRRPTRWATHAGRNAPKARAGPRPAPQRLFPFWEQKGGVTPSLNHPKFALFVFRLPSQYF